MKCYLKIKRGRGEWKVIRCICGRPQMYPSFKKAREKVLSGDLGDVVKFRIRRALRTVDEI